MGPSQETKIASLIHCNGDGGGNQSVFRVFTEFTRGETALGQIQRTATLLIDERPSNAHGVKYR
jgi:hypothetical protein